MQRLNVIVLCHKMLQLKQSNEFIVGDVDNY